MSVNNTTPLQLTIHPLPDQTAANTSGQFWASDVPSFKDLLDTINPLQHIPLLSDIYQSLTGDVPSSGANILGSTLLGGPIGLLSSVIGEIVKTQTGKDVSGNLLAMINSEKSTSLADNTATGAPSPVNHAAYAAYLQTQTLPT